MVVIVRVAIAYFLLLASVSHVALSAEIHIIPGISRSPTFIIIEGPFGTGDVEKFIETAKIVNEIDKARDEPYTAWSVLKK